MKTYNLKNRISKQAKAAIERVIDTHEEYKKSYFWFPGQSASSRRYKEKRFDLRNPDVAFITNDGVIEVSLRYEESCKNVYYTANFTKDGNQVDIRAIKKLLK